MSEDDISQIHKVIIIGSGPAGYTAAIYTARALLKPIMIAGKKYGGQLMNTTEVENYPGYPNGTTGPSLMIDLHNQAEKFGTEFVIDDVISIEKYETKKGKTYFKLITTKKYFLAFSVIVATGASAKWLNLENEDIVKSNGVSTCAVCDGALYKDKDVIVIGGGDTAMEEAIFLTKFASSVKLIHRSEKFQASKIELEKVKNNENIQIMTNKSVVEWLYDEVETEFGKRPKLLGVKLKDTMTEGEDYLSVDGAFIAIGHKPNTTFLNKNFEGEEKVELDNNGYIILSNKKFFTMTNVPGIFAAGDVCDTKYKQAISAAGSGCMSAIDCERWLSSNVFSR